jgi:hypothetical protein
MRALFVLNPYESRRFIAKAVAQLPEVKKAKEEGEIVIAHGSTNVYVAEEILGRNPYPPDRFLSGLVVNQILCTTQMEEKPPMVMIRKGELILPELTMEETLKNFDSESVFIKGANAVDAEGNAGIFVAHPSGGTMGYAYSILSARGCHIIAPVGLEKLVPSVKRAARHCGQDTLYYCQGLRIGMIPMMNAKVITEVESFRILLGLEAIHIGGGGVNGSEGSVVLVAEGGKDELDKAIELVESIKGEPPLHPKKSLCMTCPPPPRGSGPRVPRLDPMTGKEIKHCLHHGKKEEELPPYLQRRISEQ